MTTAIGTQAPGPDEEPTQPEDDDEVEEAGEESFPASDPPSTWSGGPAV
jgi:hypothetical protein